MKVLTEVPLSESNLILLSGGMDSATLLAFVKEKHKALSSQFYTLSFDYGQLHKIELEFASYLAEEHSCIHKVVRIDPHLFDKSALLEHSAIEVPKNRKIDDEIPVTYVPFRNILFLSFAVAYAESINVSTVFIGANSIDYSGYPDCRENALSSFAQVVALATKSGVEGNPIHICAPFLYHSKKAILTEGLKLQMDYSQTFSCYNPSSSDKPCGECDSCQLRDNAFKELDLLDPSLS